MKKRLPIDWLLFLLILISGLIKYYIVFIDHNPNQFVYSDMNGYVERARNTLLWSFQPMDTIYPPGYHLFLALIMKISNSPFFLALSNFGLGVGATCLSYSVARKFLSRKFSFLAVLLMTSLQMLNVIYGFYISENLFIVLLLLSYLNFFDFIRKPQVHKLVLFSFFFALSSITRGEALLMYLCTIMLFLLLEKMNHKIKHIIVSLFVVFSILIIESTLASKIAGKITFISNNSGLSSMIGWCKLYKIESFPPGQRWYFYSTAGIEKKYGFVNTYATSVSFLDNAYFWNQSLNCIKQNPILILKKIEAVLFLFKSNFFPGFNTYPLWKYISNTLLIIIASLCFVKIIIFRQIKSIYLLVPLISVSIFAYLLQGEERYLVPSLPFLIIFFVIAYQKDIVYISRKMSISRFQG